MYKGSLLGAEVKNSGRVLAIVSVIFLSGISGECQQQFQQYCGPEFGLELLEIPVDFTWNLPGIYPEVWLSPGWNSGFVFPRVILSGSITYSSNLSRLVWTDNGVIRKVSSLVSSWHAPFPYLRQCFSCRQQPTQDHIEVSSQEE